MRNTLIHSISVAFMMASTASCGGAVGDAARPPDHTAAGATGRAAPTCEGGPRLAKPLIVDLDPDSRVELEAQMKKGVAVVAFDCNTLRVLPSCKVSGAGYEYVGVSRKEQVIQMTSLDDLHVNLPLSAANAKVGGEVKSGRSIDLAIVRVGQTSSALSVLTRAEAKGACDGATHFVQNATVGAFSMATGSIGKVAAVAEMFGYGGGATSESERKSVTKDGSLDECRKSNPDNPAPPGECRSPLQVELVPIVSDLPAVKRAGAVAPAVGRREIKPALVAAAEDPCPPGYGFSAGVCEKTAAKYKVCNPQDAAECKAECDKGSPESCLNLARQTKPAGAAIPLFKKACDGGASDACGALAMAMLPAADSPTLATDAKAALAIAKQGCEAGSGYSCAVVGFYQFQSAYKVTDTKAAVASFDRGCDLGDGGCCGDLATVYFEGEVVPQDPAKGIAALDKACQAGSAGECLAAAMVYRTGRYVDRELKGFETNPEKAIDALRRTCQLDASLCGLAAKELMEIGDGDPKEALTLAERGCKVDDVDACALAARLHSTDEAGAKDDAKAQEYLKKACQDGKGDEESCNDLGIPMK